MEKITEKQYVLDCINKEYELVGSEKRFDTFDDLSAYSKENPGWFDECEFKDPKDYDIWREYCKKHAYDWLPKRTSKHGIEQMVGMLALNYGFPCRYDEATEKKEE